MKKLITSIDYGKYLDSIEVSNGEYRQQRQKYDEFLERPIKKSDFIGPDTSFEGFECKHGLISHRGNLIPDECFGITKIEDLIIWNLTLTK
jgi:hypothetical protein